MPRVLPLPLKSSVSRPLVDFDPDVAREQTRAWSPKAGANVSPQPWGCGLAARAFRRAVLPLVWEAARRFLSLRIEGLENLRDLPGPAIFAATHESKTDVVVLLAALPARWRYRTAISMGDWVFWQGWFGGRRLQSLRYAWMVLLGNVFTLAPNPAGLRPVLRHVRFLAARGWSIVIFPEGMHTPWLLPFQAGVGWMAHHTGMPIVPVYLDGMGAVLPREARWARPGSVCVRIGKPILPGESTFRELASTVEQRVGALRSGGGGLSR